jgi:hypothetical protein
MILVTRGLTSTLTRTATTCNEISVPMTGKARKPLTSITPPPALAETSKLCQLWPAVIESKAREAIQDREA